MARIPTLNDSSRISTQVQRDPTLSPNEASAGSRAAAQASGQIANALGRFHQQQVREQRKVDYTKAKLSFAEQSSNASKELELQFDGTNYEGFSQEGAKKLDRLKQDVLKSAPEGIRETLSLELESNILRQKERLVGLEANNKSKYAVNETRNMMDSAASGSFNEWNPEQNFRNSQSIKNLISASNFYDADTKAGLAKETAKITNNMVEGVLERQDIGEMQKALTDLQDRSLAGLFQDMDPKVKQKAINGLEKGIKRYVDKARVKVRDDLKEAVFAMENGANLSDPAIQKDITSLENSIVATLPADEAKEALSEINTYKVANKMSKDFAFDLEALDVDAVSEEIAVGEGIEGAANKARAKKVLSELKRKKQEQFKKDPVAYILENDTGMRNDALELSSGSSGQFEFNNYIRNMDYIYDRTGTPRTARKYLPQNIVDQYGGSINTMVTNGDYASASLMMEELDAKMGDKLGRVWDELGLDPKMGVMFEIENLQDRKNIMASMGQAKAITKEFKDQGLESDTDIKNKIQSSDLYKAMTRLNGGQGAFVNENAQGYKQAIMNEYKRLRLAEVEEDEAMKMAMAPFMRGKTVIENGDNPLLVKDDYAIGIKNFIDNFAGQDVDYVNELGVELKGKGGANLSDEDKNMNIRERGKWVYDKKLEGLRLVMRYEDGSMAQIMNKEGKPFVISLPDAARKASEYRVEVEEKQESLRKQLRNRRNFGRTSIWNR